MKCAVTVILASKCLANPPHATKEVINNELSTAGIGHGLLPEAQAPNFNPGRQEEAKHHMDEQASSLPEVAQLPLLVRCAGQLLLVEQQVCQVMHPQCVCGRIVQLPLALGSFSHPPVCLSLQVWGHTYICRSRRPLSGQWSSETSAAGAGSLGSPLWVPGTTQDRRRGHRRRRPQSKFAGGRG